jgi:uncharacterized membrane protein required for colicin V production
MILDIIIVLIVLVWAFIGMKNGAFFTIARTFGWVIAFGVAYFTIDEVRFFIKEHTKFYYNFSTHMLDITTRFINQYTSGTISSMPKVIGEHLDDAGQMLAKNSATAITDSSFNLLTFIAWLFVIKLVLFLLTLLFSKHYAGFASGLDSVTGLLLGIVQAAIFILIALAVLMPVTTAIGPQFYKQVDSIMGDSLFTGFLYENNPLTLFIKGFMPEYYFPNVLQQVKDGYEMKDWNSLIKNNVS